MRTQIKNSFKISLLLILIIYVLPLNAQRRFEPLATSGPQEFELTIRNIVQTTDRILEFDIFILNTGDIQDFELASIQAGIMINSSIFSDGSISASIVSGTSTLNSSQVPTSTSFVQTLSGFPGLSLIRLAGRAAPGTGHGSIVSSAGQGDRVIRLRLTSSVPFTSNSTADLAFTSVTALNPLYATRIARYISAINVQLMVTPGENALVTENPLLNPTFTNLEPYTSTPGNTGIRVFGYEETIVVENTEGISGTVTIFDHTGRELKSQLLGKQSMTKFTIPAAFGVYIVKINTASGPVNTKVFLR